MSNTCQSVLRKHCLTLKAVLRVDAPSGSYSPCYLTVSTGLYPLTGAYIPRLQLHSLQAALACSAQRGQAVVGCPKTQPSLSDPGRSQGANDLWPKDEECRGVTSPVRENQSEGTEHANAESREAGEEVRCHKHTKSRDWGSREVVVVKDSANHKAS